MKLEDVKNDLNKIHHILERIGKEEEFEIDYDNSEERFEHDLYRGIAGHLNDAVRLINYLNKSVKAEGELSKRADGRYYIKNTSVCFTSGSPVEVWDEIDDEYVLTRIEHTNGDYYAVGFKQSLDNIKVRCR